MKRLALSVSLFAILVAGPARAQMDSREGIALQNQILELRRDLQAVAQQRGGYVAPPVASPRGGGSGGGNEMVAQLLDRVASLEEEVRSLRGQVDEQANQGRRRYDELAKQNADLQFRLQQGNAQPAGGAGSSPPASAGNSNQGGSSPTPLNGNQPATPVRRTPELAMQEGNAALARRDYAAAETSAREVISSGRTTPRAADAQFLLAQSLAGRRDYQGAAVAYDDAYRANRQGSRAPDSLVGLANALIAINEQKAACATLDKLRSEFPSPRGDVRDASAAARAKANCR